MSQRESTTRSASKTASAPKGGRSRTKGRSIHSIILAFKALFPGHSGMAMAAELSIRTGASVSFCEKVLDGRKQPGAPMLIALQQSDVGKEILIALMADARPKWWSGLRRSLELADLVKAAARTQADIEKMQREMAQ